MVLIGGLEVFICKNEFLAVHGLHSSKGRVDSICSQMTGGRIIPKKDGRGRHNHHRRYNEQTLDFVREHINAIPKYTSHYSRQSNPNKVYLDHDINISILYRKYCEWVDEKRTDLMQRNPHDNILHHLKAVSNDKYRRIFCLEFNIGFKLPRSDTCQTCDKLKIDLDSNKHDAELTRKLKTEQECHHNMADAMQLNLQDTSEQAKISKNIDVIALDLQQNLPTPSLTVGLAFYLRKAWTYNFGIHNCVNNQGHMYLWSENVANRGSDEIMSCILKHVRLNKPSSPHLIAFSDNCGGQNKNWNVMALWQMMVREKIYETIEHRFPVPGHTRLPCDRDFGLIEVCKKSVGQVYTPDGWCELIQKANQRNPFIVTMMTSSDFYSFENLSDFFQKKLKTDDNDPVDFRNVRCFKFTSTEPDIIYVKHSLSGEFKPITTSRGNMSLAIPSLDAQILQKYDGNISLNPNKIKDLRKLLPYIPTQHRYFYNEILEGEDQESNADKDPLDCMVDYVEDI